MKKTFNAILATAALLLLGALPAYSQASTPSTTLSGNIDGKTRTITVASTAGILAGYYLEIDSELIPVQAVLSTTQLNAGLRGTAGTRALQHNSGTTVYYGPSAYFRPYDISSGGCTASNELNLPWISYGVNTGSYRWNCEAISSTAGLWMVDDGAYYLPGSACVSSVSGNASGTNGLTTVGTANMQVMQASTSATGTNTHNYTCNLAPPTRLYGKGIAILDVVFLYGVQTTALGTQAAVLASGTMNGTTIFSKVVMPAPAASETASTVTPVRADSGTMTITPAVASFNTATTTAGGFYSAKFTPAIPIQITTDLNQYFFSVSLLNAATSATVTNTPGLLVHYAYIP